MWRNVPDGTADDIARVCAPVLDNYYSASVSGKVSERAEALLELCKLARQVLRRAGGRGGASGLRAFRRQLKGALKSLPNGDGQAAAGDPSPSVDKGADTGASDGAETADDEVRRRIARATPHYLADHLSRSATTLVQPAPAPVTADTLAKLKALHPPKSADLPALPSTTPTAVAAVDPDMLLRHIRREASKAAAPGASGWTAEQVLAMWSDERGQRGLCRLVTDILTLQRAGASACQRVAAPRHPEARRQRRAADRRR